MNVIIEEIVSEFPVVITEEVIQIKISDATSYFDLIEVSDTDFEGKEGFVPTVNESTGKLELKEPTSSSGVGIPDAPNNSNAYVRSGLAWVVGYTKTAIDNLLNAKVNNTRTINSKALSSDITLNADDIAETSTRFWLTNALKINYDNAVSWISTNGNNLLSHLSNTSNPHNTTLQEVILQGNTITDNSIELTDTAGDYQSTLDMSGVSCTTADGNSSLSSVMLSLVKRVAGIATNRIYIFGDLIRYTETGVEFTNLKFNTPTGNGTYQFRDLVNETEQVAVVSEIPTTPTEVGALAIDGSNANQDVDLGEVYGLKANNVKIQTAGASKSMKILGSNLTNERTAEWQDKDYSAIADVQDITDALATFKTTEHLDATSSIQGQLNSKQPLLSYTPYKFIQVSDTPHTGTTAETILATATISGNSFPSTEVLEALFGVNKTGTGGAYTIRLKINTSNTLSGATTIATFTAGSSTAQWTLMSRSFTLLGGNLRGYPFTTSQVNDVMNVGGAIGSTAYNTANTLYMFWCVTLVSSADSITPNLCNLTNN